MIISHKYKFIFIKTNKTAGTSIEIALSRFCDTKDIITPISDEDEKIRWELGYPGPQNYEFFNDEENKKYKFYNHISATKIKQYIGPEVWNKYYKFCFERNPWDRIISQYYWEYKSEPRPSISDFIDSKLPMKLKQRGYGLYTINNQVVVDQVFLYENLKEDLKRIETELSLPFDLVLPNAKSSFRLDTRNYRQILINSDRLKIAKLFDKEIKLFNYKF